MRILYVLPALRHPALRGELRHYHFVRILGRRHPVTLVALSRTAVPVEVLDELRGYTERVAIVDASPEGAEPGRASFPARLAKARRYRRAVAHMRTTLHALARDTPFDVVLVHGTRIHRVLDGLPPLPVVVDMCDASCLRLRRGLMHGGVADLPVRLFRYWQMRRLESRLSAVARHIAFISGRDRDAVMRTRPGGAVVPNGVDLGYWTRTRPGEARHLIFTGVMDYPPNADAALYLMTRLLPEIRRAVPGIETIVAGRDPLPALVRAARSQPGVTVTGSVEDLRPYLERAAVFVAPLRFASGMQNKLLEAMAMELPVVTTPLAADGLRVDAADPPLRVGQCTSELAGHVIDLLRNADARRDLGVLGRAFVSRHFEWEHGARLLERLCLDAVADAAGEARRAQPRTSPPRGPAKEDPLCQRTL